VVLVILATIVFFVFIPDKCDEKTQYKSGSKCIEYSCLDDSNCNDNNPNTIDSCIKHSVNVLDLDNRCINKLIFCKADEYLERGQCKKSLCAKNESWKTGVESVPSYLEYQAKVSILEKALNCTCEDQNCGSCRIDGLSWYEFYYLGDKFIVTHEWDDENNNAVIEAFEYSLDGKRGVLLCAQTSLQDSSQTCPVIKANENNSVSVNMSKSYYDLRKEIVKRLSGVNRIENIIFDIYVENRILEPENNISDIYTELSHDELEMNVKDNIIYFEIEGGEILSIYTTSIENLTTSLLCEDTWNIGGGGSHSNPSCKMPIDSISAIDYLNLIKSKC
jgi:hypothetical protein